MVGDFGKFINEKRKGRGQGGSDVLLRDLAAAMGGMSVSYLSDIIKGRRNPPEKKLLDIMAEVLKLDDDEREEMYNLAGQERDEVAPDLPEYIMDESIPHVRTALRTAKKAGLGDEFWNAVNTGAKRGKIDWEKTVNASKSENVQSGALGEVIKKAEAKGLGDAFWKKILEEMDGDNTDGE
ncbi:helix-turn-helix domain-containing protein [Falcatimonas sp. MSJ-15]|uniref:helix-turn-helix domain-containing protein n=1 Tax=Falcatimonas sp. MSJ-15 TaxID=2841515 RepID=UPI001C0FD31D|nr:helix-turn-helix transcriptional regulator [Falcatimonas sp. MSJ-15]MBU5471588.1 helix-turn-helix domain-containing protein [Falcatimonas sp. MSJ-15]